VERRAVGAGTRLWQQIHPGPGAGAQIGRSAKAGCQAVVLGSPKDPADWEGRTSLNILTHESMHVRGEHNEAKTDCQAIQRDYHTGKLLGIPDPIARKNALYFYEHIYVKHPYFSPDCAPGKTWDERLNDSTWQAS